MRVPIFVALLFLRVIAEAVPVNGEKCIDEKREFEFAKDEKASFEFRSPAYLNEDLEKKLASWSIYMQDRWELCKIHPENYTMKITESSGSCSMNYSLEFINCFTFRVLLPKFGIALAGKWNIRRFYDNRNGINSYRKDNYSVNVYQTEIDHRFKRTINGVKVGHFIFMNLENKNGDYSGCRLINRKTNETYDLKAKEHRFSGKRTGIQRLDVCGFRMQIGNKSEGLWSLVGEDGRIRRRADFQLSINFPVSQEAELDSGSGVKIFKLEDFVTVFTIKYLENEFLLEKNQLHPNESTYMTSDSVKNLPPWHYWELESPDGTIFIRPNIAEESIYFDRITKDDEGIWKIRGAFNDSMVLMERNFSVIIINQPEVYYFWPRNSSHLRILFPLLRSFRPYSCVLQNRNGKYSYGKEFSEDTFRSVYSFDISDIADDESTNEWEILMKHDQTTINGLVVGKDFGEKKILPYIWRSVQRMKYVVRGEEIKVEFSASSPLTNCTLTNPNIVTKYFLDDNSLITRTNCDNQKGFCGCSLTIKNANDTHTGDWIWEMEFEGSRKVNSLAPILVVESYLLTNIKELWNEKNIFEFSCQPLRSMRYRKILYCKWFDFENRSILTGRRVIEDNMYCILNLKVSYREDLDVWKCVVGLDGSSEEEIDATFDLSKISFNITKEEPKQKLGERDEFPLKSPEAFDISSLVMVIAILISIVSSCLAIYYCVYYKMRMRKEIRKAQSVRKLLVEVKQGPLDPGTMLNEQLDYIRYNEDRWEYPWKNLEFYNEIGRGNFGYVVKARAKNIKGDGKETQVAVKRIFSTSLNHVRALVYELKILSSLTEKHPHIVNLLGACTRDVPEKSGGLWVLLEYCRCGNLHDFLEKNKSEFVSQFERIIVGQIDPWRPGQIDHSNPEECYLSESGFRVEFDDDGGVKEVYIPYHSYDSHEIAYNDIHPSGYEPKAFSTGDLMLWGLHVASGMEFLSKNKILHGDLAARNVLLTHNRMAKICDFGLARLIPDGNYQNKINEEVPFKYLAIESLKNKRYSTKTDVWSFGIFLWECFSLGKTPYEELFNSQSILNFLLSGMRLNKPIHSTDDLYDIMLLCWKKDAEDRPTFAELVQKINAFIEEAINVSDDGNVNG